MRILLSIIALTVFLNAFSQNQTIELIFTGQEENSASHVALDSIFIRNMTQGGDTMLVENDTVFELLLTGVPETMFQSKEFELIQNYPNPFTDKTTIGIHLFKEEELIINACNILGQKLADYSGVFKAGLHLFSFTGNQNAFYIVTVTNKKTTESIKLINRYQTQSVQHNISYIGYKPEGVSLKNGELDNNINEYFPFTSGDQLQYVAYSNGYQISVIYDEPTGSTDYVFEFELSDTFECGDPYTDKRDGKIYQTVQIGDQCWMAGNMNVGNMINGSQQQYDNATFEKYCYDNDEENCSIYGGLYQWDEMMQYDTNRYNQGVCPEGWHLPKISEWNELIDFSGGPMNAGAELKLGGSTGFDALLVGYRNGNGIFSGIDDETYYWTSVQGETGLSYYNQLTQSFNGVNTGNISKDNGYSVRCVKGLAPIVNENVVVIDTNIYELISDSIDLSQGIYIYQYSKDREANDILINDIIIGSPEQGYLRKVETVTDAPPVLTLQTGHATLEDVFSQLEIHEFFQATHKKDENGPPVLNYSEDNLELWAEAGIVDVTAEEFSISYDPSFYFDCTIENGVCNQIILTNTHSVTMSSIVNYNVYHELNLEVTRGIGPHFKKIIDLTKFIGFPLWLKFKAGLSAGVSLEFEGNNYTTTAYSETRGITSGIEYENGNWNFIWNPTAEPVFEQIEYSGSNNTYARMSFGPEIDILVYSVAGPFLWAGLYAEMDSEQNNGPFGDMNKEQNVGVGVSIGLLAEIEFLDIFSWTIGRYEKELASIEETLWNLPDEITLITGNNQEAPVNEQLPNPIKVRVMDNHGDTYENIPVHFTIEQGDGSLSEYDVLTNSSGLAQTNWTMGSSSGEQIVHANVYLADGTSIEGAPVEFFATAIGDGSLATVTTASISNITETSAESGGNVTDDGGSSVTEKGVCWSTNTNPTISNSHTIDGSGIGGFVSYISDLIPNTEYYVRAYATNDEGTAYGNQSSFTTDEEIQLPTVMTTEASAITATYAQTGGNVTDEGSASVTAKGVCWDTSPNPNLNDDYTTDGSGPGTFISILNSLTPNTNYYVKAYATNTYGTTYGNQISFTTSEATLPVADFTADVLTGDAPLTVTFNDISTNSPYQWFWEFGDDFTSFTQHPTHTYADEGVYTVSLTVDNVYGSDTETKTDYITVNATGGQPCPGLPTITYGGQVYNTVQIGEQCWLRENLNIGTRINGGIDMQDNSSIEKYCYDDDEANCDVYGGLYQWDEMMQYVIQEGVQGICPDGWHIPTDEEWKQLEGEVDSQYGYPDPEWDNEGFRGFDVGKNLKSTTGWTFGGNGIDSFGFNALPAGTYNPTWMFSSIEYDGLWWLSSGGYTYAWDRDISNNHDNVLRVHTSSMEEGHSVRCLKD